MVNSNTEKTPILTNNTSLISGKQNPVYLQKTDDGTAWKSATLGTSADKGTICHVNGVSGTFQNSNNGYFSNLYIPTQKIYKWIKK